MKFYYVIIICLLTLCPACDEQGVDPTPHTPQLGEPLSINMSTRAGEPGLPSGANDYYGLYCIEHAFGEAVSWNPAPTTFYSGLENIRGRVSGGKLVFDPAPAPNNPYRYPINDYLSVFLYYPRQTGTEIKPNSIPVDKSVEIINATDTIIDKYPDYLAGDTTISVIGGTPEIPSQATVRLKHLMSRVRFQIENPGADPITLTHVKLTGIIWKGIINPMSSNHQGFFTPDIITDSKTITLIEGFNVMANETVPQNIQIYPKYNYSDDEASAGNTYHDDYKYYLLVPPLSETALAAKLEIDFSRHGIDYTVIVDLQPLSIREWLPGNSYCYTIIFNTYMIEYVDVKIEPWLEELYIGRVDLE